MIYQLVSDLTDFFYDYNPEKFKSLYEDFDAGYNDVESKLFSKKDLDELIQEIEWICDELMLEDNYNSRQLYKRSLALLKRLKVSKNPLEEKKNEA